MAYNPSAIGTAKKRTFAPIVGHLEETKPFARASKAVYQPGAGPVDEKSSSSLSEMVIQPASIALIINFLPPSTAVLLRQITCQVSCLHAVC